MIKIGVAGGAGLRGKAIVSEIARNPRCELVGATVLEQDQNRGRDAGEVAGAGIHVLRGEDARSAETGVYAKSIAPLRQETVLTDTVRTPLRLIMTLRCVA